MKDEMGRHLGKYFYPDGRYLIYAETIILGLRA